VLTPDHVIMGAICAGICIAWWRGRREYHAPEATHRRAMRALSRAVTPPR
jgi:hypothetical protein